MRTLCDNESGITYHSWLSESFGSLFRTDVPTAKLWHDPDAESHQATERRLGCLLYHRYCAPARPISPRMIGFLSAFVRGYLHLITPRVNNYNSASH